MMFRVNCRWVDRNKTVFSKYTSPAGRFQTGNDRKSPEITPEIVRFNVNNDTAGK